MFEPTASFWRADAWRLWFGPGAHLAANSVWLDLGKHRKLSSSYGFTSVLSLRRTINLRNQVSIRLRFVEA
jgi:hypothetical protein